MSCEDLLCVQAAQSLGHMLVDEPTAIKTMERIQREQGQEWARNIATLAVLAKLTADSGIFAVDAGLLAHAVASLAPEELELPPLPFPSIILEAATNDTWPIGQNGRISYRIQQAVIQEEQQGARWGAVIFYQWDGHYIPGAPEEDPKYASLFHLQVEVTPTQIEFFAHDGESHGTQSSKDVLWRFLVEAVHFITAKGVSLVEIQPTRPERRRAQRAGFTMPSRLYWVQLEDKQINTVAGYSERDYKYRWIVRGHWRHLDDIRRTWVRPYVKGPVGAPWKGRPVYRATA